ncbi:MAG: type II secretion system protein J [Planctomycetota bacterium]
MTLIEILVATALTLVIMLALAQGFKTLSQGVTAGRARLTGSDQLRGISSLLRADLSGMTANTRQVPQSQQAANGYFEYYDGPLSDSTAMLYNYVPTAATPEEKLSASRWSDIDDVLMFTAKAKDGQWFRGRVPLALLKIHAGAIPTDPEWFTDVSVASEYAEIVWFMRPLNEIGGLKVDNSSTPPQLVETLVVDSAPGVDRTGDGVSDPDGMPDRVALCRRVLLIRPDLNIALPTSVTGDSQKLCQPMIVDTSMPTNAFKASTFRAHMRFPYQRCDLSVRSEFNTTRGDFVLRTNSLADLQNPQNRFAHYVIPANVTLPTSAPIGPCTSLPVLALSDEADPTAASSADYAAANFVAMTNIAYEPGMIPVDRGFIPAEFFRTKITANSSGDIVSVQPTLEEIVASNVVGFDVRGFDSAVQQLASPGADGAWGLSGATADAGAPGSDDLVVGPSDPGYAVCIQNNTLPTTNPNYRDLVRLSTGAFVDLCWGRRVVNQVNNASHGVTLGGMSYFSAIPPTHRSLWGTPLSGFDPLTLGTLSSLNRSGRWSDSTIFVYQPTFDTFTDAYESDGNRQVSGFSENGLVRYNGATTTLSPNADQGIDGIDLNDSDGIDNDGDGMVDEPGEKNGATDEELELETRPPFVYKMPAIQVKFRIQDAQAGTLQELSIVHDLTGK